MNPLAALVYSFVFGILHGVLPDEHTWPITFSYAIGGASGREGMRAGLFFSLAFTVQRALLSEAAYLALAPFLMRPTVNGVVYTVVGILMSAAGAIVLRRNRVPHVHLIGYHGHAIERPRGSGAPPVRWTIVHGFIAGFGFEGFAVFINTVAAPAMPSAWIGFLPGLLFGLGTMITLVIISALFGASLRVSRRLTEDEIKRIGSQTGGRTLFFGGLLFVVFGVLTLAGFGGRLHLETDYVLIAAFMIVIAVPAFLYSLKEVRGARERR